MANRHLSRSIVLQTLFELDFKQSERENAEGVLIRNTTEFAPGIGDGAFMKKLLDLILSKQTEIDKIIEKAAPDWPIDKIAIVDRNVLRLGLSELLFFDKEEVPGKVAINEAIELAKTFGGESSGKFINGVMGAVYKEMGEPGKNEFSTKKNEIPFEKMPIEKKVGGVVYAENEGVLYLALVHDVFGHWTLSKGGLEDGETDEVGLKRIIKEEINLKVEEFIDKMGENEYVANHPEKGKHRKQVTYYLIRAKYSDIKLGESGGLDDARWFKLQEILDLNFYDDILPLVTKAIKRLATMNIKDKK